MTIPRPEHPDPQFERKSWQNLNGEWEFEIDNSKSGIDKKLYLAKHLAGSITVPFCPESELSGVGNKDFMNAVWYRRSFILDDLQLSGRVILHFGAADYETVVWINGAEVGRHIGGYTSFEFDISSYARPGENSLAVCVFDDVRAPYQPRGKQSELYRSHDCDYTRTTGIWQTVWLEFVPKNYIKSVKFYPDPENQKVTLTADLCGSGTLRAEVSYCGRPVGSELGEAFGGVLQVEIPLTEKHLWEPGKGRLYDVRLTFGEDEVKSYFGLRSVRIDGLKFLINGKFVFQRLVLDQGFYPDGIYTAPSETALIRDIELAQALGFNGARLHQKVFEPRFLYHCDRLGHIVWGEHASWGFDHSDPANLVNFISEWQEAVGRDFNHPAIVGWCPFNETWDYRGRPQDGRVLGIVYRLTKLLDPTRPCIDTSGHFHVLTDIFDIHDYEQDSETLRKKLANFPNGDERAWNPFPDRQRYGGQPMFVSEYGGMRWDMSKNSDSWGYGDAPKNEEEFVSRLKGLTDAIMDNLAIFGLCYTQLYDVEQEANGLYTYQREPKFGEEIMGRIKGIFGRKAAIEWTGRDV